MKRFISLGYFFVITTTAVVLYSCNVTRPFSNDLKVPGDLYRDAAPSDSANMATVPWDVFFKDTLLQKLIKEGLQNNLDLKTAATNIKAAEANYAQTILAFYPSLAVTAQGGAYHNADLQGNNNQLYQLYAASS